MSAARLATFPIHLGPDGVAVAQPEFAGGMDWYQGYGERHGGDGIEGRLVSMHTFTEPWDSWECHPHGAEVVVCTAGRITLIQEYPDGCTQRVELGPGDYAINAPGVWHTADVEDEATALFITSGLGTTVKPR